MVKAFLLETTVGIPQSFVRIPVVVSIATQTVSVFGSLLNTTTVGINTHRGMVVAKLTHRDIFLFIHQIIHIKTTETV